MKELKKHLGLLECKRRITWIDRAMYVCLYLAHKWRIEGSSSEHIKKAFR